MRRALRSLACAVGLGRCCAPLPSRGPRTGNWRRSPTAALVGSTRTGARSAAAGGRAADHRAGVVAGRQPARDRARRADLGVRVRDGSPRGDHGRDRRREPRLVGRRHADRVPPRAVHLLVPSTGGYAAAALVRARPARRRSPGSPTWAGSSVSIAGRLARRGAGGRRGARPTRLTGAGSRSPTRAGWRRSRPRAASRRGRAGTRGVAALGAGRVRAGLPAAGELRAVVLGQRPRTCRSPAA